MAKAGERLRRVELVQVGLRVGLAFPTAADRASYLRVRRESERHLRRWLGTAPGGPDPFSPAAFDRLRSTARGEGANRFLIRLIEDRSIIGAVDVGGIVRGAFQSAYLGYWLAAAHTGKGYMSEAVLLALRHGFETLGLHRLEANIIPTNKASIAVVKRIGFRFEGLAKRYLCINGRWRDHEHWALTLEEWASIRRRLGRRYFPQ
jgi:ribosomal-protein-alanine N-acetyltransferase